MSLNSKIRTSFMGLKINAQTFLLIYRTRQSGKKKKNCCFSGGISQRNNNIEGLL